MEGMEEKLGAVLNNPQMMQQIMSMAQALGGNQSQQEVPRQEKRGDIFPEIDLNMVQTLSGLARQSGIDSREKALLHALQAYLTDDRVARLERAMRAAKMAKFATGFLGQQGLLGLGR